MQLPPFVYRFLINEIRLPLLCTNSTFLIEKEGFVCTKLGEFVLKTSSSTLCSNVGPVQLEISQHGGEKVWKKNTINKPKSFMKGQHISLRAYEHL